MVENYLQFPCPEVLIDYAPSFLTTSNLACWLGSRMLPNPILVQALLLQVALGPGQGFRSMFLEFGATQPPRGYLRRPRWYRFTYAAVD